MGPAECRLVWVGLEAAKPDLEASSQVEQGMVVPTMTDHDELDNTVHGQIFQDFLKRSFEKDHEKRARAGTMLFHPWLKKVDDSRALYVSFSLQSPVLSLRLTAHLYRSKDLERNKHFATQPSDAMMAEMEVAAVGITRHESIVGKQLVRGDS